MPYSIVPVRAEEDLWLEVVRLLDDDADLIVDDDEGRYHVLATVDDEAGVMGVAVLEIGTLGFGPLGTNSVGFVETVFVAPDFRGRGVGKRLICASLEYAWKCGCDSVRASVGYEEAAALSICEKLGFAFVPEEDMASIGGELRYTIVAIRPELMRAGYGSVGMDDDDVAEPEDGSAS